MVSHTADVAQSAIQFSPDTWVDPSTSGLEAANAGAIVPINVILCANAVEVEWFRMNATTADANASDRAKGFLPVYWPSVVGLYAVDWPNARRIRLLKFLF